MEKIKIEDRYFRRYIPAEKIRDNVERLACQINTDYEGKSPLCIAILNGSFMFASDILKLLKIPLQLEFLKFSSYQGIQRQEAEELIGLKSIPKNRPVLILEDIVDSGNTLEKIMEQIQKFEPCEVRVATLFFKPGCYRKKFFLHYVGMEIGDEFIVGYGLDYKGFGRNLPDIYVVCD